MANLYVRVGGGGGIECGAAHKTGARETRESEAGGVHTGPQTMAAASRRLTCRLAPCTYTHIIFVTHTHTEPTLTVNPSKYGGKV